MLFRVVLLGRGGILFSKLSVRLARKKRRPMDLEIEATIDFEFDGDGNLISPFVHSEEMAGAH